MASTSNHSQEPELAVGFNKVQVTILASEWGSTKGGLSTISRELAIQLAKLPEVEITVFLLRCSEEDKKQALLSNVKIVEAKRHPGFDELDWLSFPPEHLKIDVIVGHGVKLGHQAQVIKDLKKSKWVQVVHTDPEELGMFKSYSKPISKGQEKHRVEVELCEMADLVVGIGPKLSEAFRSYLRSSQKDQNVVNFTPGVFDEFSRVEQSPEERKQCSILVFGRGDDEDFELKGFDIAARACSSLPDFRLVFVGAPDGKHEEIAKKLTGCGVPSKSLRVRSFVESREDLKRLFREVDLVLMPSRTEGFGLTGLEALSAGLPVLVSSNSGFGEALSKVPFGSSFVIDSEDPEVWAAAIKKLWGKGREGRLEEAEMLRTSYERKYSWANQTRDLLNRMIILLRGNLDINTSLQERFADTNLREIYLHDARSILEENPKSLKLYGQQKVQEGLSNVEAETQSFALHKISYEIANCGRDIAFFAERLHKDTRQWLFEDFNTWFSNPGDSRAYVLLGDAGVGKSVIAGALAQQMLKTRQLGAAYFCRHNDGTRNDPRNLLGTIACQLCDCNCEYSSRMGGEDGVKIFLANSNLGVQELCTKLLEEPLSKCSSFQRKLVVIDALDETEYKSRRDFICLIKERFPRLPEWLVFFITSRPEDMLQSRLEKYNPCVRICAGNSEQRNFYQQHEQDIQRFLENSVDFSRFPYSAEDVTRKCNGLFLYAFYIARELNDSFHSGKVDQISDLFPGNIEDFFQTNLQRVYDEVGRDLYSKLLGCIITAPSPLPVSFISFVLHRESSSLNQQNVIDAVSQFVVLQKTVSFLHNLIPTWLTNKNKAKELLIDENEAGSYLTEIVKEVLSAFVDEPGLKLKPVESDLQSCFVLIGIRLLCQHGEKDSLKLVFRCLTSYRFLEEKIRSGRFGIYHLLKDFQYAASGFAVEEEEKQNILQEISIALENDVHVLVESPQLLRSCIQNASDNVQENVSVPQVLSPWSEWKTFEFCTGDVLSRCNCFATNSDKQTMVGAKGRSLFFFNTSLLQMVGRPIEISEDTIEKVDHLEFSSDDKFVFFGRLDKWVSVERKCVEDVPQFAGNVVHYQWVLITTDGHYIVAKTNVLHFPPLCERGCCLKELIALWAVKEIENSRKGERTCSFSGLTKRAAGIGIMDRHSRYLMKCLGADPESYQNYGMFVPVDPSCYFCCRLKELGESTKELCLATLRQLIVELYPQLFRYQIWNLRSGQPLLHDVFNQDAQLNPFAYFCHVTAALGPWGREIKCFGVDKVVSVCNIAVVTAVYFLLQLDLERCVNGQLSKILEPKLERMQENKYYGKSALQLLGDMKEVLSEKFPMLWPNYDFLSRILYHLQMCIEWSYRVPELTCISWDKLLSGLPRGTPWQKYTELPAFEHGVELFCDSFKSDFFMHFPEGFLNLLRNEFSRCLSPGKNWFVNLSVNDRLMLTRIQKENPRNVKSTKDMHDITRISHVTFTNDDCLAVYSSMKNSLHAVCLQTGKVFTSVSGCNFVLFKREKQSGYLFRSSGEERVVFLKNLFSPFKFFRFYVEKFGSMKSTAAMFSSSHTVTCINPSSVFSLWNLKEDNDIAFFEIITSFRLFDSLPTLAPPPKYVFSPDGKIIAIQQHDKITLHCVEGSRRYHCTVFESKFGVMDACLHFSADSSLLLVCVQDNQVPHFYVWNVRKRAMSESFKAPGPQTVDCFCLSWDMNNLILCGGYYEIEIWEFQKYPSRLLKRVEVESFYSPRVKFSKCTVSPDNELLVCCIANLIFVYNLPLINHVHSSRKLLRGHLGKVEFCRFLKVNRYLISYAIDGMVFLWDVAASKAIGFVRIAHGEEKIVNMVVSPEEDKAICFSSADRVCMINLCMLERALSSKFLTAPPKGMVDTSQPRLQPVGGVPAMANVPNSSSKHEMLDAPDLEERFLLTADDFFESDDSD